MGTDGQVLTGNSGADPSFAAIGTKSGLTTHGLLLAQGAGAFSATAVGTNGQVLVGVTGSDPVWGTVSLTTGVTGILPIVNGGTNASSMTNTNGVNYFDGTRIVTTTVGTAGQVLTSNGSGVAPTFQPSGGGGGGGVTVTTFNSPGATTFTKAGSTKMIEVFAWGGGGGGSNGGAGFGGYGGGNGGAFYYKIPASFISAPVTVVVGAGGTGGNTTATNGGFSSFGSMTTNDPSGLQNGGFGGDNYLGTMFTLGSAPAYQPSLTQGGTYSFPKAGNPLASNGTTCRSIFQGNMLPTGGGSGGIFGSVPFPPGNGGSVLANTLSTGNGVTFSSAVTLAGGLGASSTNGTGSNGNDATGAIVFLCGGTGGGGGDGTGGGGDGGFPGGGGGGGGPTGGIGGDGGDGLVIVVEYA